MTVVSGLILQIILQQDAVQHSLLYWMHPFFSSCTIVGDITLFVAATCVNCADNTRTAVRAGERFKHPKSGEYIRVFLTSALCPVSKQPFYLATVAIGAGKVCEDTSTHKGRVCCTRLERHGHAEGNRRELGIFPVQLLHKTWPGSPPLCGMQPIWDNGIMRISPMHSATREAACRGMSTKLVQLCVFHWLRNASGTQPLLGQWLRLDYNPWCIGWFAVKVCYSNAPRFKLTEQSFEASSARGLGQ